MSTLNTINTVNSLIFISKQHSLALDRNVLPHWNFLWYSASTQLHWYSCNPWRKGMGNMCKHTNQENRAPQKPVINAFQWISKRDNTSMIFRNPLHNLLEVFERQNEKHTCYSSAFMELITFAKISAATFWISAFTHFPAGWKGCAFAAAFAGLETGPSRHSLAGRAEGPTQQHWCVYQERKRFLIN